MVLTQLKLINRALNAIKSPELGVLDDNDERSNAATRGWDSCFAEATIYPWHFLKVTAQLSRLAAAPARYWTYRFQLPADRLELPEAYWESASLEPPLKKFEIEGDQLLTDAAAVWARYKRNLAPAYWPGYFVAAFETMLAARYAKSIAQRPELAKELREQAVGPPAMNGNGGLMGQARLIDSRSAPSGMIIADGPLIEARG